MKHDKNKLANAILERLAILLNDEPKPILRALTEAMERVYPELHPEKDADILEDKALQSLINYYDDQELEDLWRAYNYGYFKEDTYESNYNNYYVTVS